jgi:uncharacterized membrane protein
MRTTELSPALTTPSRAPGAIPPGVPRQGTPRARWHAPARVGFAIAVLIELAIFVPALPLYYQLVRRPCAATLANTCVPGQLTPGALLALRHLGISLDFYANFALGAVLVSSLVFFAVGALIAWRRWHEAMGLFVALLLITVGATGVSDTLVNALATLKGHFTPSALNTSIIILVTGIIYVQWPAFGAFLLTFPTGRFTPRWTWGILLLWVSNEVAFILGAGLLADTLLIPATLVGTLAAQVYRYRHVYNPTQRQQAKWLVFAIAVAAALGAAVILAQALAPLLGIAGSPAQATDLLRSVTLFLPLALAIGVAILRYRLYDIDVIINRALIYGTLTVTLALVYFAAVIGAQAIIQALTGQHAQPSILIVATTLLVAALFNPLRHRIQRTIERRFYRHRYDAARTIEAFAAALGAQTDLEQLNEQLVQVVRATMEPAHVSLWLRPSRPPEVHAPARTDVSGTERNPRDVG